MNFYIVDRYVLTPVLATVCTIFMIPSLATSSSIPSLTKFSQMLIFGWRRRTPSSWSIVPPVQLWNLRTFARTCGPSSEEWSPTPDPWTRCFPEVSHVSTPGMQSRVNGFWRCPQQSHLATRIVTRIASGHRQIYEYNSIKMFYFSTPCIMNKVF